MLWLCMKMVNLCFVSEPYTETFSGTLSWELCPTQGRQPKVLGHSTAVVGDTLYIFGGIHHGIASDALYILNTGKLFLFQNTAMTTQLRYIMLQVKFDDR